MCEGGGGRDRWLKYSDSNSLERQYCRIPIWDTWQSIVGARLELSFQSEALRRLCESRLRAIAALGGETAGDLMSKLADLDAAQNAADFLSVLAPEDVLEIGDHELFIAIGSNHAARLRQGHVNAKLDAGGNSDWEKVTRMKVIFVGERL